MIAPRMFATALTFATAMMFATGAAAADSKPDQGASFGSPDRFGEQGGETIFHDVCAACHMPDGRGATGAGAYPALAADTRLEVAGYPVSVVLHGQKAMPPLGAYLSDRQVADVVNYIRTHLGNDDKDAVTEADVKAAR